MPTPVEWLAAAQINTGDAATDIQFRPRIIGLSNGNILVAWVDGSNGLIGTSPLNDIVGVILDATGAVVVDAFQLNTSVTNGSESNFDVAATSDGGFVMSYISYTSGSDLQRVIAERFDAAGIIQSSQELASVNATGNSFASTAIALDLSDGSFVVTWSHDDGTDGDQRGRRVDAGGNLGAEFAAGASNADDANRGVVALLGNGNYVTIVSEEDSVTGVSEVKLRIFGPDGSLVTGRVLDTDAITPSVTSLIDGGFVAAWRVDDGAVNSLYIQVFNNNGTSPTGPVPVVDGGADVVSEPTVVALPSGGFAFVWSNLTDDQVLAQAYLADGTPDGTTVVLGTALTADLDASVTADGRLAVTWEDGSDIFATIWDPRGGVIDVSDYDQGRRNFLDTTVVRGGVGADQITGSTAADTIHGEAGHDVIQAGQGNDLVHGDAENDALFGNSGNDTLYGGTGNDLLAGGIGNDLLDGGAAGFDTADYINATGGVTAYLLFTGLDVGGGQGIDTLVEIENLSGSNFDDRLSGDAGDNLILGDSGNDTLNGKEGNDQLYGGDGSDKITSGAGNDRLFGGFSWTTGNDSVFGLAGNDLVEGAGGNDFLYGGLGNDTVEGGAGDDEVRGNIGNDQVLGEDGNDDLRGGAGDDTLYGIDGDDFLFGENGRDTLEGGAGDDALTGGFGAGVLDGLRDVFVYADVTRGNGGFDRIKDFENGIDVIDLSYMDFTSFAADVLTLASDTATGLRIDFGGGDVLFVENFFLASFDASDVIL